MSTLLMADSPGATDDPVIVRCENLVHVFGTPGAEVAALRGVDFNVRTGQMVALLGPSGAGKSTLLWHLAGLLRPTAGTVDVNGHRLAGMSASDLASFRLREIGVVLQNAGRNLLPYLSAIDNMSQVQAPLNRSAKSKRTRAFELLDAVGIAPLAHRRAGRLSGGEQQRLALAVALANDPALLLADEPTSQLDPVSAMAVVDLIRGANAQFGTTVVVVTHDSTVGAALDRTVTIRDGRVGAEGRAGEDYVVVGRDGTVQIPPDLLDVLPPGSLARAVRTDRGVELRPVESPGEEMPS
jgi:putative ABC transport system ATP-binding protein